MMFGNIRPSACLTMCLLFASFAEAVPVTFRYSDPAARRVTLAGEFNEWDKDDLVMAKNDTGEWEARVDLEPGIHEYKYVVDGNWDKANKDSRMVRVKKEEIPISNKEKPVGGGGLGTRASRAPMGGQDARAPGFPPPPTGFNKEATPVRNVVGDMPAASAQVFPEVEKSAESFDPGPPMAGARSFTFSSRAKPRSPASPAGSAPRPPESAAPQVPASPTPAAVRLPVAVPPPIPPPPAPFIPEPSTSEENTPLVRPPPGEEPEVLISEPAPEKIPAGIGDAGTWGRGAADPAGIGDAGTWGRGAADPAGIGDAGTWGAAESGGRGADPAQGQAATGGSPDEDVTFRYSDAAATSVSVAGDFNAWKADASLMAKGSDGVWELTLPLAPGEYGYKFVVNGQDWKLDPGQALKKDDGFGGQNSMVRAGVSGAGRVSASSAGRRDRMAEEALESGVKVLSNGMVRFVYVDPAADQVYLGGSFNGWLPDAWPMMKMSNGIWVATIKLKAGIYTYKYNIGGVWKLDPGNPMTKEGGYGPDSLLEIASPVPADRKVSVPFTVRAEKARRVTLAGEFNGWDPNGIELRKKSDGWWSATIDLKPGTYEYKFLADGDWESLSRKPQKIEVK